MVPVQIIVRTATPVDENDDGWSVNGAGLRVSYKYGFGRLDAGRAVAMARDYANHVYQARILCAYRTIPFSFDH